MPTPRRWIRLDVGWSDSEWVSSLEPAGRLAWIEMLVHTKRNGVAGRVKTMTPAAFARKVRVPEDDVRAMIEAAKADGALDEQEGMWVVANWTDYQGDAAERMRRYRASKSRLSPLRNVTARYGAYRNVTDVTRNGLSVENERDVRALAHTGAQVAVEVEVTDVTDERITITEKENPPWSPLEGGKALKGSKRKRMVPLPDDWQPNGKHREKAAGRGIDIEVEAEKMRDWAAAKDERAVNWDARFHLWLNNARRQPATGSEQAAVHGRSYRRAEYPQSAGNRNGQLSHIADMETAAEKKRREAAETAAAWEWGRQHPDRANALLARINAELEQYWSSLPAEQLEAKRQGALLADLKHAMRNGRGP